MPISVNGANGITFADGSIQNTGAAGFGFKNRIINGAMVIAQYGTGSSAGNGMAVDRFKNPVSQAAKLTVQQNAGSVTPPAGFTNYYGMTSSSAYSVISTDYFLIGQSIEGLNITDLGWGTANAQTVTLSFWVRSSLTGTFGGSLQNSAQTRTYPYSYTISSANTWEYKTVTIAGDTTGTWLTTNGVGVTLWFSLGVGSINQGTANAWAGSNVLAPTGSVSVVGTNGATFYITGVQLEKGSTATSFDYRPYGTELQLAQRYFVSLSNATNSSPMGVGYQQAALTTSVIVTCLPVSMRTSPTATFQNLYITDNTSHSQTCSSIQGTGVGGNLVIYTNWVHSSGGTAFRPCSLQAINGTVGNCFLNFSAEL